MLLEKGSPYKVGYNNQKYIQKCNKIFFVLHQDVMVVTTVSFQGQEQNFVILNTTRSNKKDGKHNIGFLRDSRRLSVGTTRSIDYFCLVTDVVTLVKSGISDMARYFNLCVELTNEGSNFLRWTRRSKTRWLLPTEKNHG